MKKYFIFILFPFLMKAQETVFSFKERIANKSETFDKLKFIKSNVFYEDENYKVRKTCSGEWGGTVYFENKKTNKETAASATCVINVNRIDEEYFVTSSLTHMSGSTEIIEIDNPAELDVFKLPKPKSFYNGKGIYSVKDVESKSKKGTKKLLDSIGIIALASFVWKNNLYHLYTDTSNVYLATIENKKFKNILKVYDKGIFGLTQYKTKDSHLILYFKEEEEGYFDIQENEIILTKFK